MSEVKTKTEITSSSASAERGSNGKASRSAPSVSNSNSGGENTGSSGSSRAYQHNHNQYPYGHYMKWGGDRGAENEDESVHYFSEPSLSEEGDSATEHLDRSLLSDGDDDTDDRATPPPPPPGPPPPHRNSQASAASTTVASPGNTSLSSWESHFRPRHPNHHVRIHFSPETTLDRHHYPYNTSPYYHHPAHHLFPPQNELRSAEPQQHHPTSQQQQPGGEHVSETQPARRNSRDLQDNMTYSTFSHSLSTMSSVSAKERKKLDAFIHDLRQSSEGSLQESAGNVSLLNTSTEDSATSGQPQQKKAGAKTVLRINTNLDPPSPEEIPSQNKTHRRISSVETELIGNTSDALMEEKEGAGQRPQASIDDSSLVLNLSVLGDEDLNSGGGASELNNSATTPVSRGASTNNKAMMSDESNHATTTDDDHHHSADDEQTEFRPPRRRAKPSPSHRRTRSGDNGAAALALGGKEWVGMSKDKIPMPEGYDDDDDNDTSTDQPDRDPETTRNRNGNSPNKKKIQSVGNDKAVFAMGASEGVSRVAARKQRREIRQQQRTMAEKAAAAARQQRIHRQFQEWSHSPLFATQQNVSPRDQTDASETNSFGTVPSTVGLKVPPNASNMTNSSCENDGVAQRPQNSLDSMVSGLSSSAGRPNGPGPRRRNSAGSNNSFFSWISASNNDAAGDPYANSPSPTLKVTPNWSPQQSATMVSPGLYQRKFQQQQRQRQTLNTMVRYPLSNEINQSTHSESQDAFLSFRSSGELNQSTRSGYSNGLNQSNRARSASLEAAMRYPNDLNQSNRSQPQEAFMRYLMLQQQTAADHDSFRRHGQVTSPYGSVLITKSGSSTFPPPPLTTSMSSQDRFTFSQHSNSGSSSGSSGSEEDDDDEFMNVMRNRVHQPNISLSNLDEAEQSAENVLLQRGSCQHVLRGGPPSRLSSPFANFGRKIAGAGPEKKKFDRAAFLPKTSVMDDNEDYPTYRCPRCQTIQREFFTVDNAPRQFETVSGFLALSFVVYVIASLYIFGLEEGWPALDCIYFAVITLTTAGLGDFVPTSDFNKIICSIFIYFGVACIGLLLGSYIAAMLDETTRRQARENRINACPNCARLQNIKDAAEKRALAVSSHAFLSHSIRNSMPAKKHFSERMTFDAPAPQFSLPDSDLDFSADEGGYESGNKKIKRRHNSNPTIQSPPFSLDQSGEGVSPREKSNADETSPFTTTSKSSANPSPMDRIPEEGDVTTTEEVDVTEIATPKSQSQSKGGALLPNCNPINPYAESPSTPRQDQPALQHVDLLGSPMTKQILGRQSHTRHTSIDLNGSYSLGSMNELMGGRPIATRNFNYETPRTPQPPTITEHVPFVPGTSSAMPKQQTPAVRFEQDDSIYSDEFSTDDSSIISSDSYGSDESDVLAVTKERVKTAKYVFVTLKQALVNSLVIIAVGCLGFWFVEGFTLVDSWYFTTVLLTTVGYGDIVPVTKGGKLFATIYILVAGAILLNNMSLISLIPLELRKRRIERAVLTQFGDLLDDDALRELASGPLIQRLNLSANHPDGLNYCTREMFALAMLVRLGKVTVEDIQQTFGAFNRLDVNRDGVLNSKSIIAGMIHKSRSKMNLPGMRRINSSNMLKTPAPVYVASQDCDFSGGQVSMNNPFAPASAYQAPHTMFHAETTATTETSALLHNGRGYNSISMLSRSN